MLKKKLGKLVLSATGLRKMANYLQKQYKTKGDILIDCSIITYNKQKTFGYETQTGRLIKK